MLFNEHHESHAASPFYPLPLSLPRCDGWCGRVATTSAWFGDSNNLTPLWEIHFPHSLGLLYSAFTYYTGFKVNSGEYKVMGAGSLRQPQVRASDPAYGSLLTRVTYANQC
jgi:carbamoyltransferase